VTVTDVLQWLSIALLVVSGCILIGVTMPRVCDRLFDWHNMRQNRKLMDKAPLSPTQFDYESVHNAKEAAALVAQYRFETNEYIVLVKKLQTRLDEVYAERDSLRLDTKRLETELTQARENYDKLKPMAVPMRQEIDLFLNEP